MFSDNDDHSNHAGKTWERTSAGRVPVGIDTTQTEFDTIGKQGGHKKLQKHAHKIIRANKKTGFSAPYANPTSDWGFPMKAADGGSPLEIITETGTGDSENLQPYQVFAFWRRTA